MSHHSHQQRGPYLFYTDEQPTSYLVLRVLLLEPLWFPRKQALRQGLPTSNLFESGIPGKQSREKGNEIMCCVNAQILLHEFTRYTCLTMREIYKKGQMGILCLEKFH